MDRLTFGISILQSLGDGDLSMAAVMPEPGREQQGGDGAVGTQGWGHGDTGMGPRIHRGGTMRPWGHWDEAMGTGSWGHRDRDWAGAMGMGSWGHQDGYGAASSWAHQDGAMGTLGWGHGFMGTLGWGHGDTRIRMGPWGHRDRDGAGAMGTVANTPGQGSPLTPPPLQELCGRRVHPQPSFTRTRTPTGSPAPAAGRFGTRLCPAALPAPKSSARQLPWQLGCVPPRQGTRQGGPAWPGG